ncbi:dihydroxyacetone kinase DhaL subunit [Branchiibius hedensis]|uniref:Dihydroxyacetone kinase DhaL subunit n=1 Tax=Branchiibius hedensis TaxID=672460 RepID=A0A2Y9BT63_9MICO|nr:dihydroxyacetone kinase subunit DhaL [Branchiibius hedensis]PWJ24685.1 dihydroxyacetone kinase DhaL subunit [Branchiibius hedensis]SSA33502.1 dihydroxyacetone kinase DhaL subunit [Branchiibius hedensis]
MALSSQWVRDWVARSAQHISDNRTELIRLDREIGDGDHGENMDRGFKAVSAKVGELPADASPSDVLKTVATTLISTVGGASGPLYGTAFLKASQAVKDHAELDSAAVVDMLRAARDGIVSRGKAEVGDKTMVDAWSPAVQAAEDALAQEATEQQVLAAAADAAKAGSEKTDPLIARKGRASYLGERAIGHRDPGSVSSALLLMAAAEVSA